MAIRLAMHLVLVLFVIGMFAAALPAQTPGQTSSQTPAQNCGPCPTPTPVPGTGGGIGVELYFNAGGIWPTRPNEWDNAKLRAQAIYGLKGGVTFGGNAELEGSFGFLNHFQPRFSPNLFDINTDGTFGQPGINAFLYDVNGLWNFGATRIIGARVAPYIVAGVGGLTTEVRHGSSAFLLGGGLALDANGNIIHNPARTKIISDGDTFFTVNYGVGIKAMNLWGPLGLRADVRGRTIPNLFGSSVTWPEITGGFLLSWGER
jgi:hypothetical protein